MLNPRLAGRYAKSLIDLSVEKGLLEEVYKDMRLLQSICKSNRDFVVLLKSPVIKADKKGKIIEAVTSGRISELTRTFNSLMVRKGREAVLPEVADAFIDEYNKIKNIHRVKLSTAQPVSEALKQEIIDRLKATGDMPQIELETVVKDELIGGFVLEFDNKLLDASIIRDLKDIKKQFEQNIYVKQIR